MSELVEQGISTFLGCAFVYKTEEKKESEMSYVVEYVSGTAHCDS